MTKLKRLTKHGNKPIKDREHKLKIVAALKIINKKYHHALKQLAE